MYQIKPRDARSTMHRCYYFMEFCLSLDGESKLLLPGELTPVFGQLYRALRDHVGRYTSKDAEARFAARLPSGQPQHM